MAVPRSPKPPLTYDGRKDARIKRHGANEARRQIAADLDAECAQLRQAAQEYADDRSPLLEAQADALADAALRIRSGGDGDGQQQAEPDEQAAAETAVHDAWQTARALSLDGPPDDRDRHREAAALWGTAYQHAQIARREAERHQTSEGEH